MCGLWLAGVLTLATGPIQPDAATGRCILLGACEEDVALILGQPDAKAPIHDPDSTLDFWMWKRVDWLGGIRVRKVTFDDGAVRNDRTCYYPFRTTPPWLDAIRDAIAPVGK